MGWWIVCGVIWFLVCSGVCLFVSIAKAEKDERFYEP